MAKTRSLNSLLSIGFIFVGLAPIILITALVVPRLIDDINHDVAFKNEALARSVAGQVELYLRTPLLFLHALRTDISTLSDSAHDLVTLRLDATVESSELFEAIYLINDQGRVKQVGLPANRSAFREDYLNLDLEHLVHVHRARDTGEPAWSSTFLSVVSGRMSVALALPWQQDVLVGDFNIDQLSSLVRELTINNRVQAIIVDKQGHIIAHPVSELAATQQNISNLPIVVAGLAGQEKTQEFTLDAESFIGSAVNITGPGWIALVTQPAEDAYRNLTALSYILLFSTTSAMLLAVIAALYLARQYAHPFERISSALRRVDSEAQTLDFPDSDIEEVQNVTKGIKSMLDAIADRQRQLTDSERKYRHLFDSSSEAIFIHEAETGRILDVNDTMLAMYNCSYEQALDATPDTYSSNAPPYNTAEAVRRIQLAAAGSPQTFEWQARRQSGELFPVEVALKLAEIDGERRIVAVVRDISERQAMADQLYRDQERLRLLVSELPAVLWTVDNDLRFTTSTGAGLSALGLKPGQIVGQTLYDFFQTEDPKFKPIAQHLKALKGQSVQYQLVWDEATFSSFVEPLRIPNGEIVGCVGLAIDLTETLKSEQALQDSEARFITLAETLPCAIFRRSLDDQWTAQYLSPHIETITGFAADLLIDNRKRSFVSLIYPDDVEQVTSAIRKAIYAELPWQVEYRIVDNEGNTRWIYEEGRGVYDDSKQLLWLDGFIFDNDSRKRSDQELTQLRSLLGNIVNSMPSILIGITRENLVSQWNRAAEESTGVRARDALGRPLGELLPQGDEILSKIASATAARRTETLHRLPVLIGGKTQLQDIAIYPLVDQQVEGAVIRIDDVTEKARLEEMMVQSEKMLSVGGLAAGMAHEINNPLAAILQNIQVLRTRLRPDNSKNQQIADSCNTDIEGIDRYFRDRGLQRMLDAITDSGLRAAKIVDNMLSFARKSEANIAEHHLPDLMDTTIELAQNDYDLKNRYDFRQINIVRDYESDLPPIECEATKIQQVFLNILKNGAEAMTGAATGRPEPLFTIRIRREAPFIRIDIGDNGPGMSETTRKRVFEPFYTTKGVGIGTGLGLSVSYFIITENHLGAMTVETAPDHGANFIIRLPFEKEQI